MNPEDYMPVLQNIQNLDLGSTSQVHICDIIKSLQPKNSTDIDGISTKLLKNLAIELSWPLAHIFNLSLTKWCISCEIKIEQDGPHF